MTLEEAVEEVLNGQAWDKCFLCQGQGMLWFDVDRENVWKKCHGCRGLGYILLNHYKQACELLGKELPTRPPNTISFQVHEEILMGRFNPEALKRLTLTKKDPP